MGIKVVDHSNLGNASPVILTHFLNMGDHLMAIYHDIWLIPSLWMSKPALLSKPGGNTYITV